MQRRLNVSNGAGGITGVKRARFDAHLDSCDSCKSPGGLIRSEFKLCSTAQTMWRAVCLAALRQRKGEQ